jgi:large subunit ribosomal protein L22
MQARAIAKNIGVTPRKARLIVDLVRGKAIEDAYAILENTNKSASLPVLKVIKSATANAVKNLNLKADDLFVKEIFVDEAIKMRRFLPRAKGSASGLVKRWSHITAVVSDEIGERKIKKAKVEPVVAKVEEKKVKKAKTETKTKAKKSEGKGAK